MASILFALAACIVWRRKSLYRSEFPRIYELRDLAKDAESLKFYFRNLDKSLSEWPLKRKQFRDLEETLRGLGQWEQLKSEVEPLLVAKAPKRGWQAMFDILNHAKAYNYLRSIGCIDIEFIPVSRVKGQRTPDLQAVLNSGKLLCEVKTINASKIEAERRHDGGVGTTTDRLDAPFFGKLRADFEQAREQMQAYCSQAATKRMVYVVVNFDDHLHEYAERYQDQIGRHLRDHPVQGLEVVLDIKPPFYSVTV